MCCVLWSVEASLGAVWERNGNASGIRCVLVSGHVVCLLPCEDLKIYGCGAVEQTGTDIYIYIYIYNGGHNKSTM